MDHCEKRDSPLAMDSIDISIIEGLQSDDDDIRDKAMVNLTTVIDECVFPGQEKFCSLSLDDQLQLLVSVFAKTTVEKVGDT